MQASRRRRVEAAESAAWAELYASTRCCSCAVLVTRSIGVQVLRQRVSVPAFSRRRLHSLSQAKSGRAASKNVTGWLRLASKQGYKSRSHDPCSTIQDALGLFRDQLPPGLAAHRTVSTAAEHTPPRNAAIWENSPRRVHHNKSAHRCRTSVQAGTHRINRRPAGAAHVRHGGHPENRGTTSRGDADADDKFRKTRSGPAQRACGGEARRGLSV